MSKRQAVLDDVEEIKKAGSPGKGATFCHEPDEPWTGYRQAKSKACF